MKTIFKIAWGNIRGSGKRSGMTLLGVVLSVALITIVSLICSSMMADILKMEPDPEDIRNYRLTFRIFTEIACVMGCILIYTAFSAVFSGRIKVIGLLTTAGASRLRKSMIVLFEAAIYGVAAIAAGLPLGTLAAKYFYEFGARTLGIPPGLGVGVFTLSAKALILSASLSFLTVITASVIPMIKLRRISVMDSVSGRETINISLRQSFVAEMTERVFGYYGRLAGQNYDNNKKTYRGISLALSGGTTMFYSVYCFFMYIFRLQSVDDRWGTRKARAATFPDMLFGFRIDGKYAAEQEPTAIIFFLLFMILTAVFVAIALVCASSGASVSMDKRRGEHAMLKSIGMTSPQLCRIMCIECIYLTFYSAFYGLIGAYLADVLVAPLVRLLADEPMMRFYFPSAPYLLFLLLDIIVGVIFAVYTSVRVSHVNIIEAIRDRSR